MRMHLLVEDVDIIVDMEPAIKRGRFIRVRKADREPVKPTRVLTFDRDMSNEDLLAMDELSKRIKESDIEIDTEHAGKIIESTSMLAVRDGYEPAFTYKEFDILERPDGDIKERPHLRQESNVNEAIPVRVTDQHMSPRELLHRFVFRKSYFMAHQDGASYKILHGLATRLQERGELARLQAHDQDTKKPALLVLVSGTVGFAAAFVEGMVEGDKYCLLVHLADRELRLPEEVA